MVFSSVTFLFFFLPPVLAGYLLLGSKGSNLLLLASSLLFYAWGEGIYLILMLASIAINYAGGRLLQSSPRPRRKPVLAVAVFLNLLLLGYFKYAAFVSDNLNLLLETAGLPGLDLIPVRLPIGISFFTFQALSYLIDVYRGVVPAQRSLLNLALYISLFPQLIAGPIVRYHHIAGEIAARSLSLEGLAQGIRRFVFGLSKKVLLANPLAAVADQIFALPATELTAPVAWLGALCYTLQIYFDFSGYSDMAIGLGRMFGFHFLENFNYPYISRSIREFWQRWHISLSSWFRDYLYIPLGGNRHGPYRTGFNLITVFLLCGLWHGAAWTFVIWGLFHGLFLILERSPWRLLQQRLWTPLRILLTMLIVCVGWVLFRSETFGEALAYLGAMFGLAPETTAGLPVASYLNAKIVFELGAAMILALPVYPALTRLAARLRGRGGAAAETGWAAGYGVFSLVLVGALSYFSIISLAAGVYNPFIYFRF